MDARIFFGADETLGDPGQPTSPISHFVLLKSEGQKYPSPQNQTCRDTLRRTGMSVILGEKVLSRCYRGSKHLSWRGGLASC